MKINRIVVLCKTFDTSTGQIFMLNGNRVFISFGRYLHVGDESDVCSLMGHTHDSELIELVTNILTRDHQAMSVNMSNPNIIKFLKITNCIDGHSK